MKRYLLIIILFIGGSVVFGEENLRELLLKKFNKDGIELYCSDDWFLEHSGFTKQACLKSLKTYGAKCNELIRPLIPLTLSDGKDNHEDLKKFGNLGELYSLCLSGLTFQEQDQQDQKNKRGRP